ARCRSLIHDDDARGAVPPDRGGLPLRGRAGRPGEPGPRPRGARDGTRVRAPCATRARSVRDVPARGPSPAPGGRRTRRRRPAARGSRERRLAAHRRRAGHELSPPEENVRAAWGPRPAVVEGPCRPGLRRAPLAWSNTRLTRERPVAARAAGEPTRARNAF